MWFPICLHCCGSLLRFQAYLPSCDQPLCDSRLCGRASLKRNVLRTNRAQKKVKKKPQQRNARTWREKDTSAELAVLCLVKDKELYLTPHIHSFHSALAILIHFFKWMMGCVTVWECVEVHVRRRMFLGFVLQVVSGFSRSGLNVSACMFVSVRHYGCVCICCSLPLMSCWHTDGKSLLKKTSVWIWLDVTVQNCNHSTSKRRQTHTCTHIHTRMHIHAHNLQSVFKWQTRAVLLS